MHQQVLNCLTNHPIKQPGLNHKIFLCPCELSNSERVGRAVIQKKLIPGGNKEADFLIRKSCHALDGMIKAVTESHKRNICFNGNLLLENFRITEEGDVKLIEAEAGQFSKSGAKLDNGKVADIIEFDFFADTTIPPSIDELLKLLRTGEQKDEEAMSHNISLMPETERMALFEWMLKDLETLENTDPTAYKEVIDILEAHSCCEEWYKKATMNEHLAKISNYIDRATGKKVQYPMTVKGLLRFARNCIEHLPKYSYDPTTKASLYYLFEIDHIVSGTYQGLFEALQSAMSAAGKICKW